MSSNAKKYLPSAPDTPLGQCAYRVAKEMIAASGLEAYTGNPAKAEMLASAAAGRMGEILPLAMSQPWEELPAETAERIMREAIAAYLRGVGVFQSELSEQDVQASRVDQIEGAMHSSLDRLGR